MTRSEIAARLLTFLQKEFPSQGVALTEDTDLLEEWFVDSLGIIETVLFLEQTFGIDVTRADINGSNFQTVAALSTFVERRLEQTLPA